MKILRIIFVLVTLLIITSCSNSEFLNNDVVDSGTITNTATNSSITLTKDEAESIIESLNKQLTRTKDIYKLDLHIQIVLCDADKKELYKIYTSTLESYSGSEPQVGINGKTYNISKDFFETLDTIYKKYNFDLNFD